MWVTDCAHTQGGSTGSPCAGQGTDGLLQALGALFQRRWPPLPAFLPRSLRLRETVGLLGLWNRGNGGEKVGQAVLALPAGSVCLHGPQQGTPTRCLLVGT